MNDFVVFHDKNITHSSIFLPGALLKMNWHYSQGNMLPDTFLESPALMCHAQVSTGHLGMDSLLNILQVLLGKWVREDL